METARKLCGVLFDGIYDQALAASVIDTALAEARLEGARAMREAAACIAETHAVDQTRGYIKVLDVPPEGSNFEKQGKAIRALSPQAVIENVRKSE
jgi:uncharacterized iron-regulated protein